MMNVKPSMVMTEYRIHYVSDKAKADENNENVYFEIQVPFEDMDQCWTFAKNIVDIKYAQKVSISTKLAHFYFRMGKAVIAVMPSGNLDTDEFHAFMGMIFAKEEYIVTRKSIVFK